MNRTQILIKFTGPSMAENVISALALEPELLIPLSYGKGMTEKERGRLNHFFHRRSLPTIVAEPVLMEEFMEADMETRLERLFEKYRDRRPVVDVSDADVMQAMAVGAVLARHQYWAVAVMDLRVRERLFLPLKNAGDLRRLTFPRMTEEEFRFLGKAEEDLNRRAVMVRRDLTREAALRIRTLGRFYAESPVYWRDAAQRFRYAAGEADSRGGSGGAPSGRAEEAGHKARREFILDVRSLGIRDSAFEDLRDAGILDVYERKGGIVRYRFVNETAMGMLYEIAAIPLINVMLMAAQVREYGKNAAITDLALYDYTYVTGILRCCPIVMQVLRDGAGEEALLELAGISEEVYGGFGRRILVYYTDREPDGALRAAADRLQVELIFAGNLIKTLEPR